jgi:catechol 2,3-dioxygenase-like lactoylglutathione lyase family enzyme
MISRLDHLVLTVEDIEASVAFYVGALGMRHETFGAGRHALRFGDAKINLHQRGREFSPRAATPTPGSADLCFVSDVPVAEVAARLAALGIAVEEGPVPRTGATGPILSIYVRDPDRNLVEISNYA